MNNVKKIQEYIDQDSGRRAVSVTFDESGSEKTLVIPFHLLADDLLGFLADASRFYANEIVLNEGFQKFEQMILDRASKEDKP